MSPKSKMKDIHDDRDDDFDNSEEYGEIQSFVFSNTDPYAKAEPRPDDAPNVVLLSTKRVASVRLSNRF